MKLYQLGSGKGYSCTFKIVVADDVYQILSHLIAHIYWVEYEFFKITHIYRRYRHADVNTVSTSAMTVIFILIIKRWKNWPRYAVNTIRIKIKYYVTFIKSSFTIAPPPSYIKKGSSRPTLFIDIQCESNSILWWWWLLSAPHQWQKWIYRFVENTKKK